MTVKVIKTDPHHSVVKEAEEKALVESAKQKISREELAALKKWLLK